MSNGKMSQVWKTLKMLSSKPSSYPSALKKFSQAAENHGKESYSMDHLEQEKHF